MEYIAAALEADAGMTSALWIGSTVLRVSRERDPGTARSFLVGIAAMHALETDEVLELAARVRKGGAVCRDCRGGATRGQLPTRHPSSPATSTP